MLKWTVYGKKQEIRPRQQAEPQRSQYDLQDICPIRSSRHSLDAHSTRRKNKYQRRSLGSTCVKRANIITVDKENINHLGSTPNFYREGFISKKPDVSTALKDVSNITPTAKTPLTPNNNDDSGTQRWRGSKYVECCPATFSDTPPSYARRIREAKKRKLELNASIYVDDETERHERVRVKESLENVANEIRSDNLANKYEEDEISRRKHTELRKRVCYNNDDSGAETEDSAFGSINNCVKTVSSQNATLLRERLSKFNINSNTTSISTLPSIEIEYSPETCIKGQQTYRNSALKVCRDMERSTLPIFGSRIFMENPLYFNFKDLPTDNNNRNCKLLNKNLLIGNSENILKSPSENTVSDSQNRSPVSITPLSKRLSALRFSSLRLQRGSRSDIYEEDSINLDNIQTPLTMMRDDEISTEMENKFILPFESSIESTISDSQMGDITLDRMIDDILKSTKKIRDRRPLVLSASRSVCKLNHEIPQKYVSKCVAFVKPCEEKRSNQDIKEAKHIDLSGGSPKSCRSLSNDITSATEKSINDDLLSNPNLLNSPYEKSYILTDLTTFNEREVRTPDNKVKNISTEGIGTLLKKSFEKSCLIDSVDKTRRCSFNDFEITPNLNNSSDLKIQRLKRQKCVRRKKSTAGFDGTRRVKRDSYLTLEKGLPSPCTPGEGSNPICDPLSSSFNCIAGLPIGEEFDKELQERTANVSTSSLLLHQSSTEKHDTKEKYFGLTLENGIPSPDSPVLNLKRAACSGSAELQYKSSKQRLDINEDLGVVKEVSTPVLEQKFTRRCLTYSPDDENYSSAEKRRSVASSRSGRCDKMQNVKGTIDLKIHYVDGVADVHVIRCRDLQRSNGKSEDINAYAKVAITGNSTELPKLGTQRAVFRRTSVLYGRSEPEFQRHLKLPMPAEINDTQLINISVWHRDKKCRRSEFLGCVAFPLKHAIQNELSGTFHLQYQSATQAKLQGYNYPVEHQRIPSTSAANKSIPEEVFQEAKRSTSPKGTVSAFQKEFGLITKDKENRDRLRSNMASDIVENPEYDDHGGDQSNVDKASEDFSKLTPSQQHKMLLQREADEHLFLRYLELDPVIEPTDAVPPTQKKPPTNKAGRTPFTTTRRLQRDSSGGFGFTVVWTRPPRVERVLGGAPAERAGVRPGDFLVFVGTRNVVTAPEDEVRQLVKNAGSQLIIETFRRTQQNGVLSNSTNQAIPPSALLKQRGSAASHVTISDLAGSSVQAMGRVGNLGSAITGLGSGLIQPLNSESRVDFTNSHQGLQSTGTFRPGTACSGATTTQSLDINVNNLSAGQTMSSSRRKLQLPQVTFSKEPSELTAEERLRAALSSVVCRERRYAAALRHGLARFAAPLADRADLIAPTDHRLLFQNLDEILQLSEEILEQVSHEDCDLQTSNIIAVYLQKTPSFLSIYKRYCLGLKRADCVLVRKSRDTTGAFVKFCTSPPLPRRRPDITSLVHKPLEQFRELLRLLRAASSAAAGPHPSPQHMLEKKQLQVIVDQLQAGYQEVTAGSGLMGLAGEGKPLLSVADLESRLVFTRCKPFVLSTPGRQWIFGGDLSRVEGRSVRPYWALLFSDLLLFAKVSRDRVLFITEEPVLLSTVKETCFNVRKKATEFRLVLGRPGGESPTVHCTPRLPLRARLVSLRAPSPDLKAVWQSLLQRQIYRVHTMSGTPLGSPLDSPDPQTSFSLATLELDSQQRQQGGANGQYQPARTTSESQETLPGRTPPRRGAPPRGAALHLAQWMSTMPANGELEQPESDVETWSLEDLKRRSRELNLTDTGVQGEKAASPAEKVTPENEKSPSKSSSDSQITVRTSPVILDKIPVCRQCHNKCLSKPSSPFVAPKDQNSHPNKKCHQNNEILSPLRFTKCDSCEEPKRKFNSDFKSATNKIVSVKDVPTVALKIIDSIEKNQRKLRTTSDVFPNRILSSNPNVDRSSSNKSVNYAMESPIPQRSNSPYSRNESPISTSHTTCSSMVFNSSANDLRTSSPAIRMPNTCDSFANLNSVQCVIAQEKYLNEVRCVENVVLSKSKSSSSVSSKGIVSRKKVESVLTKVLGVNIIAKRERLASCLKSSSVFLDSGPVEDDNLPNVSHRLNESDTINNSGIKSKTNGDVKNKDSAEAGKTEDGVPEDDMEWGPLMLMGLSAINPAAHLVKIDPFRRLDTQRFDETSSRQPIDSPSQQRDSPNRQRNEIHIRNGLVRSEGFTQLPNIAIVPPTPDYNTAGRKITALEDLQDDSPDSPPPDDLPYSALKRYGTLSSLERFPSDETDDETIQLNGFCDESKPLDPDRSGFPGPQSSSGLMGWTARAGSFVVEKMAIFNSYADTTPKQPSFLERYLGVGEWKAESHEETAEGGEGSGASGEEAWGTPSSGELSDVAFPDSDHGTLSSPTKSSSSYAGDDDTELMMDELLMTPTIAGPTLRPLLPRRRLEPLMEEDGSESDGTSEDNTPSSTANNQGSSAPTPAPGRAADGCSAPAPAPSDDCIDCSDVARGLRRETRANLNARAGASPDLDRDRTPTNETPSPQLLLASRNSPEQKSAVPAGDIFAFRRGDRSPSTHITPSTISAPSTPSTTSTPSTPSTLQRRRFLTTSDERPNQIIQNLDMANSPDPSERLTPRAEMRLALDRGQDMLADIQDVPWGPTVDLSSSRWAVRRVTSAAQVTCAPRMRRHPAVTTSHNSVYAWKETEKVTEMERLARAEARTRTRQPAPTNNGRILGFLRRRASSDSPDRPWREAALVAPASPGRGRPWPEASLVAPAGPGRPFSPRRAQNDKAFERRFWRQLKKRRKSCSY